MRGHEAKVLIIRGHEATSSPGSPSQLCNVVREILVRCKAGGKAGGKRLVIICQYCQQARDHIVVSSGGNISFIREVLCVYNFICCWSASGAAVF